MGAGVEVNGVVVADEKDFFACHPFIVAPFFFGDGDEVDGGNGVFFEEIEGDVELSLASVDDEQVG